MKRIMLLTLVLLVFCSTANAGFRPAAIGDIFNKGGSGHDVRAYGAKGDGVTDDTAATQAAIDAASADGGGIVSFPSGDYISTGIDLKSNVTLQGVGRNTSTITGSGSGEIVTGTAQSATASTIVLAAGESAVDHFHKGNLVYISSGTGAGQYRFIKEYTGATKTVDVSMDWSTTPDATSVYTVNRALIQSDAVNSRRYYMGLENLYIVSTGFLCAVNWSDISHGRIQNCYIHGVDTAIGINLRHQAYVNLINHNRTIVTDKGIYFSAGVDADDQPNANDVTNNSLKSGKTGIEWDAGYSGVNNNISGGYLESNNVGILVRKRAQKITNVGMEGAGTDVDKTTAGTTTYTATTVVDGTAIDLSSVDAGWVAKASTGELGIVLEVDDGADTVTVDSWYPSQPANATECKFIESVGIVLKSTLNSIFGCYMGGGYAGLYILDPGNKNLSLNPYQPLSTNSISVSERSITPLKLTRYYTNGNSANHALLSLIEEGTGASVTASNPDGINIDFQTASGKLGTTGRYLYFHNDGVEKFKVLHDGGVLAGDLVANTYNFAADAEASDTYVIALDPAPAAYVTGMMIVFTATTANTGACTVNVNGLGAKALKMLHDQDPADNYIEAGSVVLAVYDGTNFQMIQPDANP